MANHATKLSPKDKQILEQQPWLEARGDGWSAWLACPLCGGSKPVGAVDSHLESTKHKDRVRALWSYGYNCPQGHEHHWESKRNALIAKWDGDGSTQCDAILDVVQPTDDAQAKYDAQKKLEEVDGIVQHLLRKIETLDKRCRVLHEFIKVHIADSVVLSEEALDELNAAFDKRFQ